MITITITGTAREVIAEMQSLLRQDPANVPVASEAAVEEAAKPAPKPRSKPAAEKPSPEKEPASDAGATSSKEPSSAADNASDVTTIDCSDRNAVKNYFSAAIDNLGPQIVQEVMAEHGAKKFGDIDPSKYEALVIRLSDLQQAK